MSEESKIIEKMFVKPLKKNFEKYYNDQGQ